MIRSSISAGATLTLVLLCSLAASSPAAARDDAEAAALRERAERALAVNQNDEELRADWEEAYRELRTQVRDASERLAAAKKAERSARKRHRLRGGVRVDLEAAIEEHGTELRNASDELEELRERARLAGVPRGWLEAVDEEFSAPASGTD